MELFGKSLARSLSEQASKLTPGARRKLLAGAVVFGLGVLPQLVGGNGNSLLGAHTKAAELVLMALGLAVQFWALVDQNFSSSPRKSEN